MGWVHCPIRKGIFIVVLKRTFEQANKTLAINAFSINKCT